jgi:tetratricopeptide (TPR) repeat protein
MTQSTGDDFVYTSPYLGRLMPDGIYPLQSAHRTHVTNPTFNDYNDGQSFFLHKRCIDPNLPESSTPYGVAKLYEHNKDFDTALEWFAIAIEFGDRTVSAVLDVAGIYSKFGDIKGAIDFLEQYRSIVPQEKMVSFNRLYERLEWDLYKPPNRMSRMVEINIVDASFAPLDYVLCQRIFPNSEKVRVIVSRVSGMSGYVEFDSHSAARKAVYIEKNPFVSVDWPTEGEEVAIPPHDILVKDAISVVNGDRAIRGPVIYTVPEIWTPPIQVRQDPESEFVKCVIHCLNFTPSKAENSADRSWLLIGSMAESERLFDVAFEIYAKLATRISGGLCDTVIEARIRMALLVAIYAGDYELACELLGLESNAVENILHDFAWLRDMVPVSSEERQNRIDFHIKMNDLRRTMLLPDIFESRRSFRGARKRFPKEDVHPYLGA